jgi:hypothetical protein
LAGVVDVLINKEDGSLQLDLLLDLIEL